MRRVVALAVIQVGLLTACGGGGGYGGGGGGGAPTITSVAIAPPNSATQAATSERLAAIATYSDNSTSDVTAQASWSSSSTSVATVSQGTITGVAVGVATITASVGSVSGNTTVTIGTAIAPVGAPNVEPITVDAGPPGVGAINTAYVTVKVCQPGTTQCVTIDHVQVDTGASGLRILASFLKNAGFALNTPLKDASNNPFTECEQFADGTASYGSIYVADLNLPTSGEAASSVNVQVIGDRPSLPPGANGCTGTLVGNSGVLSTDQTSFGANGLLGVGPFIADCDSNNPCPQYPGSGMQSPIYYSCPTSSTCAPAQASNPTNGVGGQQVQNPVALFATDHNGIIIELPSVASSGTTGMVSGSLVFGIGTQTNNGLGSATALTGDAANNAFISSTFKGTVNPQTYLDSGSNGNFFTDSLTKCPGNPAGFYCPASTVAETATLKGLNSKTLTANFSVGNIGAIPADITAFPNAGGPSSGFDLGLPFYFGRNVATALENANAAGTIGPYFAY